VTILQTNQISWSFFRNYYDENLLSLDAGEEKIEIDELDHQEFRDKNRHDEVK
jgi:hypothetical protein